MTTSKYLATMLALITAVLFLAACANPPAALIPTAESISISSLPAPTEIPATATQRVPTETIPEVTDEIPVEVDPFVLGEPGPYFPGMRQYNLDGFKRDGVQVRFTVWYPAVKPEGYAGTLANEAEPDQSGKPYPLVIMSKTVGEVLGVALVSQGFVVAGVNDQGPSSRWGTWLVEFPREIVAMLEQIATSPPEGLEGIIDSEHVGAMGYSFDGYNSLALSGARVDPAWYLQRCSQGPESGSSPVESRKLEQVYDYFCGMADEWEAFVENAGEEITNSQDGLWQPITDERIQAVMPMAPEGVWLFGDQGLAAVDKPVLMICGTVDEESTDYRKECAYIFEHMGTSEKGLVSFINQKHGMPFDLEQRKRMSHFITAFFGYHLQGREDYAQYLTRDFVEQQDGLAWGVYESK